VEELFTPIEQKIFDLLRDGETHHRSQLLELLDNEMAIYQNLFNHITNIRRKIQPNGLDLLCRRSNYRLVRFITVDDK
jgi:hypothetical protein